MQQNRRVASGKHRKPTTPITGRVAFVALATTTVSGSAASGIALAHTTSTESIQLTASETFETTAPTTSPQILPIAEFKPSVNLTEQLNKAVEYSQTVAAAEEEARTPKVVVALPAEGQFTSPFGPRWGTFHNGIDIANVTGTPIHAVMAGTVIDAGPASGYGNWVRIQHDDGSVSVYGHMETIDVSVGQHVDAGQIIAGMGNRGFSTGTHLHFEIHPDGVTPVDPAAWLAERGIYV